jgi:hypothetical protein
MVAAGVIGIWAVTFFPLYEGGHFKEGPQEELLFAVLIGLALVNWYGASTPRRKVRVSLNQAILAALLGWVGCLVAEVESFVPIGLLGGMALCVGFLCPLMEDLSQERQAVRARPRRHAERGASVERTAGCARNPGTTAEPSPSREMKRQRWSWWWMLLLLPFLLLKFSSVVIFGVIVGTVVAIRELIKTTGKIVPGGVREKDPFGVEAL